MKRLALLCGLALCLLGGGQAAAQLYCPSGEGSAAAYQAAVECQRQNLALRRQQAADQQARQRAAIAEQQAAEALAYAEQQRIQAQALRQAQARQNARQQAIRDAADAQRRAEQSPDNVCAKPDVAGPMLSSMNEMLHDAGTRFKVVDAERLVTRSFDPSRSLMACHGVFIQSNGHRVRGTFSTRLNVAGDPLVAFSPD